MMETPIQVDGKLVYVAKSKIVKAVVIPGKLVNLLTRITDPRNNITVTQGVRNGKPFKRIKVGSKVPKAIKKGYLEFYNLSPEDAAFLSKQSGMKLKPILWPKH